MYGTIAKLRVRPENHDKLKELFASEEQLEVAGFVSSHLMLADRSDDEAYLVVFFEDRDSYTKNADDPAQDERYQKFRALLEADPEWIDGDWTNLHS